MFVQDLGSVRCMVEYQAFYLLVPIRHFPGSGIPENFKIFFREILDGKPEGMAESHRSGIL